MQHQMKLIVSMMSLILFFTCASFAEKKYVPIVMDDLLSMASYYTSTNNLQVPIPSYDNEYNELVVQCEEDISYFIMSYQYYDAASVTVDSGDIVIDENVTNADGTKYIKGHIEGNQSIAITGSVYYENELRAKTTKTCRSNIDNSAYPAIPNYPAGANSYGILELNCKDDIIYYTLSYACFKTTVKLSVTANGKPANEFEESKQGSNPFIYYEFGYVARGGSTNTVEVVGTITGGNGGGPYKASCP